MLVQLEWVLWDEGRTLKIPFRMFKIAREAQSYAMGLYLKGERNYLPTLTLRLNRKKK